VLEALAWFEQTAFSVAVREVPWVFPFILIVHSLGMGLAAGAALAIGLRRLGFASGVPASLLARFLPLMWIGFAANTVSGLLLLAGYPAKALTNPVFYCKLALLGAGVWMTHRLAPRLLPLTNGRPVMHEHRRLAALSLIAWAGVIFTGRFLAYTHKILLATWAV